MKLVFVSNWGLARGGIPLWLEAAVLAAVQGNEVAIVVPKVGQFGTLDPRLAQMGVRIVFCPLKRGAVLGSCLGIGRAKRLAWWREEFPEPPDVVCLAADGWRESLPGCLEWLKERRIGYVEAVSPPRTHGAGRKTKDGGEPRMTRNDTRGEAQGGAWASQAGVSEPDSLISKLADAPVSESPTRSASAPASSLATRHAQQAPALQALDTRAKELLAAMYRVAAQNGVTRYHKWSGLPFLWDEEWI